MTDRHIEDVSNHLWSHTWHAWRPLIPVEQPCLGFSRMALHSTGKGVSMLANSSAFVLHVSGVVRLHASHHWSLKLLEKKPSITKLVWSIQVCCTCEQTCMWTNMLVIIHLQVEHLLWGIIASQVGSNLPEEITQRVAQKFGYVHLKTHATHFAPALLWVSSSTYTCICLVYHNHVEMHPCSICIMHLMLAAPHQNYSCACDSASDGFSGATVVWSYNTTGCSIVLNNTTQQMSTSVCVHKNKCAPDRCSVLWPYIVDCDKRASKYGFRMPGCCLLQAGRLDIKYAVSIFTAGFRCL